MPVPERFDLTAGEVAAVGRLAGLTWSPGSLLAGAAAGGDPATVLPPTASGRDGRPRESLLQALGVLDNPTHALVASVRQVGDPSVSVATFVGGGPGRPTVMVSRPPGGLSLLSLPSATWSLIALDDVLGLSDLPTLPTADPVRLSGLGLTTLAAVSDVILAAGLTAQLRRELLAEVVVRAGDCEQMLAAGGASADNRWAVAAVSEISPVAVGTFGGRMPQGLSELVTAGLVRPVGDGVVPTAAGGALCASLQRTLRTALLTVAVGSGAADGRGPVMAMAGVLRGSAEILLARWDGQWDERSEVVLGRVDGTDALDLLDRLLHPVAPPPEALVAPPSPAAVTPALSTTPMPPPPPGAPLTASVPAVPPPPPAAPDVSAYGGATGYAAAAGTWQAPPWQPTHVVPDTGLDAFAEPDIAVGPAARLDPGLPVVADEAWGDWFHIVCENGWQAWVDGRFLTPIR